MPTETAQTAATKRDRHIAIIAQQRRIGGSRSLVEVAMLRYKVVIGRTLRDRTLPTQKAEAKIGCKVLNVMTALGMPISYRIA